MLNTFDEHPPFCPGFQSRTDLEHTATSKPPGASHILKYLRLLLLLFLSPLFLQAQILDFDRRAWTTTTETQQPLTLLSGFSLNLDQEQELVSNLKGDVDLSYLFADHLVALIYTQAWSASGEDIIKNAGYAHLRFRLNRMADLQPEFFVQYQWNGVRGMLNRQLLGSNIRLHSRPGGRSDLFLALGLMMENERWDYRAVAADDLPVDQSEVLVRAPVINSYIKWIRGMGDHSDLTFVSYFQYRIDDRWHTFRISPVVKFNTEITKTLGVNLQASLAHDENPIVPVRTTHFETTVGVTFSLK
jgi:hypothetical protein